MAATMTTPNTLVATFAPADRAARLGYNIAAVVLGTVALAIAAKIQVPTWPVHVTLQGMVVAMLAASFGARIGVATIALYLAEGLAGLPVFSTGGGPGYVLSPSFGFIVGWLPMAYIIGRAADRGLARHPVKMGLVMIAADAVSFLFGFVWLMVVASIIMQSGAALPGWLDSSNLLATAFNGAVRPFIVWDILKMAFAAVTVAGAWALVSKR